jgi:hypothetical protein
LVNALRPFGPAAQNESTEHQPSSEKVQPDIGARKERFRQERDAALRTSQR